MMLNKGWNYGEDDEDDLSASYSAKMRRNSILDRRNLILISSGSELLMINKIYFYKYADLTTICKIEKQVIFESLLANLYIFDIF